MSEYDPRYIRINEHKSESDQGEWFDPDIYTHRPNDTLYVKETEILEHLVSKGWRINLVQEG